MKFEYLTQPAKKWTFEQPRLKQVVERWCKGRVLNLFAGKVRLSADETRVDISGVFQPDHVTDALSFVKAAIRTKTSYHTIILDPPYNIRKAREKYNGNYIGSFTKIKDLLPRLLNKDGRVITLGYNSVGMSRKRGFEKLAICLVCHNGDHNDTICLVEQLKGGDANSSHN